MDHHDGRRVGADPEERGLAESQDAGEAAEEIDRDGQNGIEQRPSQNVHREGAEQKGCKPDRCRARKSHDGCEPDGGCHRSLRPMFATSHLAFKHGRSLEG